MEYSTCQHLQDIFCCPSEMNVKLEKFEFEIGKREWEITRLQRENEYYKHQNKRLQETVNSFSQEKPELHNTIHSLREELKRLNFHVDKLEEEIKSKEKFNEEMEESMKEVLGKVTLANQCTEVLQEENAHLKSKIDNYQLSIQEHPDNGSQVNSIDNIGRNPPFNENDDGQLPASQGMNGHHHKEEEEMEDNMTIHHHHHQLLKGTDKVIRHEIDKDLIQCLKLIQKILEMGEKNKNTYGSFSEAKLIQLLKFWRDPITSHETRVNKRELWVAVRRHLQEHENQNKYIVIYTHGKQMTELGRSQNIAQFDIRHEEKTSE